METRSIDELTETIVNFIDRNGRAIVNEPRHRAKVFSANGFVATYEREMGRGIDFLTIKARYEDLTLLSAEGHYSGDTPKMVAEVYRPGDWTKIFGE